MKKALLFFVTAQILAGCYPNPTEFDYCVVPCVNNRDITREKEDPLVPKASF